MKVKGAAGRAGRALPHPEFWRELTALDKDGATFAAAKARRRAASAGDGDGGAELLLGEEEGVGGAKATAGAAAAAGHAAEDSDSDSSGDDVVEWRRCPSTRTRPCTAAWPDGRRCTA
jgi:hypothetical protein